MLTLSSTRGKVSIKETFVFLWCSETNWNLIVNVLKFKKYFKVIMETSFEVGAEGHFY